MRPTDFLPKRERADPDGWTVDIPPAPVGFERLIGQALKESFTRLHKGPSPGDWVGLHELNVGDVVLVFEHEGDEVYSARVDTVTEINHPTVSLGSGTIERDDFYGVLLQKA